VKTRPRQALTDFSSNVHSQFGEDGVIERAFVVIGETTRVCCEFGAWDGLHFSNTRALVERGWHGVFVEADPQRFEELRSLYPPESGHVTIRAVVDDRDATIGRLLAKAGVHDELDFLSIDIDGEDYYVLRSLDLRPRLLCIEAIATNPPDSRDEAPRALAARGVGQPLQLFVEAAEQKGYRLIGYTGNAFFVREDVGYDADLPTLTAVDAWDSFVERLPANDRSWLYKMNLGLESP
jgi:hypothetical protein